LASLLQGGGIYIMRKLDNMEEVAQQIEGNTAT
jgi:hypothetical protein